MMKIFNQASLLFFASVVAASLAVVPGAQAALRRGKNDKNDGSDNGGGDGDNKGFYVGALITINHFTPPPEGTPGWDPETPIIDAIVKVDRKVNSMSDYNAQSGYLSKLSYIPDNGDYCHNKIPHSGGNNNLEDYRWSGSMFSLTFIYWGCSRFGCSSDDDFLMLGEEDSLGETSSLPDTEAAAAAARLQRFRLLSKGRTPKHHKVLEAVFCKTLRDSGTPGFEDITTCSVDYLFNGRDGDGDGPAAVLGDFMTGSGPWFFSGGTIAMNATKTTHGV